MLIENEIKLDYKDVLFRPKRSTLKSRQEVDLFRTIEFANAKGQDRRFYGIPIIASNMDGVGTFEMATELRKSGLMTCLVKTYSQNELVEYFDSDSAFVSSTNYRFTVPSGKAGKYFFYASWQTASGTDFNSMRIHIYKNGSSLDPNSQVPNDEYTSIQIAKLLDLAESYYVEIYAYQNSGGTITTVGTSIFYGYKIIE